MTKSVEIVRGLYEAFGRGDVAAVLAAMDDQIHWQEAEGFMYADRNPYIGPAAVAEGVFQRLVEAVENFTVTPRAFIAGTDAVAVEGRYGGRARATGAPIDAQFAHVWRLRDDRIVGFQQYTDTRQWALATGAVV